MPENWQLISGIAGVAGLLLGIGVARRSHAESQVHTTVGHIFNYFAAAGLVAVPVSAITGLVIGNFRTGVTLAIVGLAIAIVWVLLHAIPESLALRDKPPAAQVSYFRLTWNRWKAVGQPIGDFNSRLLMGLLYFTLMLPFGLLLRVPSGARLNLKPAEQNGSLWINRDRQPDLTIEEARRQS